MVDMLAEPEMTGIWHEPGRSDTSHGFPLRDLTE